MPAQLFNMRKLPPHANGCPSVVSYSTASATLALEHQRREENRSIRALVNVDLVLERIGPQETRVGEWVNVIGYITAIRPSAGGESPLGHGSSSVCVQALLLWSAGSLDVQRYEASVDALNAGHGSSPRTTLVSEIPLRAWDDPT